MSFDHIVHAAAQAPMDTALSAMKLNYAILDLVNKNIALNIKSIASSLLQFRILLNGTNCSNY